MSKVPLNNKGFAPLLLLVGVAAVLVVGGGGLYVYHQNHKLKSPAISATTTKNKTGSTPSTVSRTSTTSYLTISQWSVRAPYSGADLTDSAVSGNSNEVWISSQELASTGGTQCAIAANSGNLGYVGRYLPTDTIPSIPPQQAAQQFLSQNFAASNSAVPSYAKVGSYYYIYWPGEACSTNSSITQLRSEVGSLVNALQAIPQ